MKTVVTARMGLSESFQQYAVRNDCQCTCGDGPAVYSGRYPWGHSEGCSQYNLYLSWRAYTDAVFPGRVCPDPPDLQPQTFPDVPDGV
jgi:hypothetical protein